MTVIYYFMDKDYSGMHNYFTFQIIVDDIEDKYCPLITISNAIQLAVTIPYASNCTDTITPAEQYN